MSYSYVLPCITAASGLFAASAFVYRIIRHSCPVKANCWFCNKDQKVPYMNINQFLCAYCQQYNGFSEDGDYNCIIPAQHCETLNPVVRPHPNKRKNMSTEGFCESCNSNQAVKIKALAEYSSVNNYDKEIEEFRQRLERMYALCQECEAKLNQTLGKQDSWLKPRLIAWRVQQSKNYIVQAISQKVVLIPTPLRFFLTVFSLAILVLIGMDQIFSALIPDVFVLHPTTPDFAISKHQISIFLAGVSLLCNISALYWIGRRTLKFFDIICCSVWVLILVFMLCKELMSVETYNTAQSTLAVLAFILSVVFANRSRSRTNKSTSGATRMRSASTNYSCNSLDEVDLTLSTQAALQEEEVGPSFTEKSTVSQIKEAKTEGDILSNLFAKKEFNTKSPKTLNSTFENLRLCTPEKLNKNSYTKTAMNHTSNVFNRSRPSSPNLIAPSKLNLRPVTHSSWVAGGYWGLSSSPQRIWHNQNNASMLERNAAKPQNLFGAPLSRSSSQSSGFISQGAESSSPLFSCQSSLIGDADRASLASERSQVQQGSHENSFHTQLKSLAPDLNSSGTHSLFDHRLNCSGHLSCCSEYTPHFPINSTCSFRKNAPSMLNESVAKSEIGSNTQDAGLVSYRNPWMAFMLGVSMSANAFLVLVIAKSDVLEI